METKYRMEARTIRFKEDLKKRKKELKDERYDVIEGIARELIANSASDNKDDAELKELQSQLADINERAKFIKECIDFIDNNDYEKLQDTLSNIMAMYDEDYVFIDEQ